MVLAVVDDLLFSSKIRSAAGAAGQALVFLRSHDAVLPALHEHRPHLVLIDLDRDALDPLGLIKAIRSDVAIAQPRIVGFGSHVRVDRLQAAREAGCDQALARSAFVAGLPTLLAPLSMTPSVQP